LYLPYAMVCFLNDPHADGEEPEAKNRDRRMP